MTFIHAPDAPRARRLLALAGAAWLLLPSVASAATCCLCNPKDHAEQTVCLTAASGSCADNKIITASGNDNLKDYVCGPTELDPNSTCLSKSSGGLCTQGPTEAASFGKTDESLDVNINPIVPNLNVPIPGLEFASKLLTKGGFIEIPYLAQYIAAVQRYLLGISVIAASVMVVYGGFLYVVGASLTSVSRGKEIIKDAIVGLFLMLGAYTIVQTLNPDALTLSAVKIQVVNADTKWISEHGTGDAIASAGAADDAIHERVSGPSGPQVPFTGETVDLDSLPFDKSKGGPGNLAKYIPTDEEVADATTYEKKIKLLARSVLGMYKVCVQNHLCAYCQGCFTDLTGGITAMPNADFVVKSCAERGINSCTADGLWGRYLGVLKGSVGGIDLSQYAGCRDIYQKNPYLVNGVPKCLEDARQAYRNIFVKAFTENKIFGGDCGSTGWGMYSRTRVPYKESGGEKYPGLPKPSIYLSAKSLDKFNDRPDLIVASHMDADLEALAAPKGGFKFGDMVYVSSNDIKYANHWIMYTGGRPDVPFSVIEMGGGDGAQLPGPVGRVAGVGIQPPGLTVQDYVNKITEPQWNYYHTGKIPATYDKHVGIIYVWRPYAD